MDKKKIVRKQWIWFAVFCSGILLVMGQVALESMTGTFLGLSPGTLQTIAVLVAIVLAGGGFFCHTYYMGLWTWRKSDDPKRIPFGL